MLKGKERRKRIQRRQNKKIWDIIKYVIAFIFIALFILCIISGFVLDLTYQGILNFECGKCLLSTVKKLLKPSGLSHADLWEFITSNTGVLVALVGMFFTFTIDIYERSEKKIFGVLRKELTDNKHDRLYRGFSIMATVSPLLMLIYIIFGFCASSYFLLFLIYIFLVILYGRHRGSYEKEKIEENLCGKLLKFVQVEMNAEGKKTYQEYKNYLINIYDSVRLENNWVNTEELYFKFLDMIRALDDEVCFATEYYFFVVVFDPKNKTHGIDFFPVVERYVKGIRYNGGLGYADRKDAVLLWGMLAASVPYAEEKELINFLRGFSDFGRRSQCSIRDTEKEISDEIIQEQCAMLLILLEGWMELYDVKRGELIILVKKIYERGEREFVKADICNLEHVILLYEAIGDKALDVTKIFWRFVKEKRMGIKISLVANLVKTI